VRDFDLKSLVIAGVIGAALLWAYEEFSSEPKIPTSEALGMGFVVGAGVQFALRVSGVS
jgi:hypothetical protein